MSEAGKNMRVTGEVKHSFMVGGDVQQGFIVGRDLYLGDRQVVQETFFFEPDLQEVTPPSWTTTPMATVLANSLARDHLVVLAGNDFEDLTLVARHIALLLRDQLRGPVHVREWYRSSDPQKIETAFHATGTTILLLPQVQPHHIGHRFSNLKRLLHRRGNYVIITTESPQIEWGIQDGSPDEQLWHEISWETYYGRTMLSELLIAELTVHKDQLPAWIPEDIAFDTVLFETATIEHAASLLKHPERIRRFVQWVCTDDSSPQIAPVKLEQLGGDLAAISQWYRTLQRSDQMLALGLVLFDGLPDDQTFAALEFLVTKAWRESDPNLPIFDYKDLDRLTPCFRLTESDSNGTRIESSSRQRREAILRSAWEVQRRRLLAIVPAITRLLKHHSTNSTQPPEAPDKQSSQKRRPYNLEPAGSPEMVRFAQGAERELFSSQSRVEELQRAIIEALSQIGRLSFEAVEASFLELAVDGSIDLQAVVAKALAAWRGEGYSTQLFTVLHSWWKDGCFTRSLITHSASDTIRASMRGTVALALGYSLQYDPPNQMAPELVSLFRAIVKDQHPAVRQHVLQVTLPLATMYHLRQLEPILREQVFEDGDHLYTIAYGASLAFSMRSSEALEVLGLWQLLCRDQQSSDDELAGTPRDRLISTVALAYGYVRFDKDYEELSPAAAVTVLRSILATEQSPFVRTHSLMAMGLQAVDNFSLVAPTLLEFISEITLPDRYHVASVLTRAYLRQREQLSEGHGTVEVDGRTFQVWRNSERPLTPIENELFRWLSDNGNPIAQQVAVQGFATISATSLEKEERDFASRRPTPATSSAAPAIRVQRNQPRLRKLGLLGHAALFLVTPRDKEARGFLAPIMAEVIEVERAERLRQVDIVAANASGRLNSFSALAPRKSKKYLVTTILGKWKSVQEEALATLTRRLSMAMDIFRWRWAIVFTLSLAVLRISVGFADWLKTYYPADQQTVSQQSESSPSPDPTATGTPK